MAILISVVTLFIGIGVLICCVAIGGAKLAKEKMEDEYNEINW